MAGALKHALARALCAGLLDRLSDILAWGGGARVPATGARKNLRERFAQHSVRGYGCASYGLEIKPEAPTAQYLPMTRSCETGGTVS